MPSCVELTLKKAWLHIQCPLLHSSSQIGATEKSPHDLARMRNAKWTSVVGWYRRVVQNTGQKDIFVTVGALSSLYSLLAPMTDLWPESTDFSFPSFSSTLLSQCSKTPDPAPQPRQWANLGVLLASVLHVVRMFQWENTSKTELRFLVGCHLRWIWWAHPEVGEDFDSLWGAARLTCLPSAPME